MRRTVATLTALLTAVALLALPSPASASARGDWWRSRAVAGLNKYLATGPDGTVAKSFAYGMALGASANLHGWDDPRTLDLLGKLRALRNPDGGYGTNLPRDVFNDGTVNPSTTSYTVTMAGHVGPALLAGYKAGKVSAAEVQTLVNLIVRLPRVTVTRGACVAFSTSLNDTGWCVHNVNAGAAWFLHDAAEAGFGARGMHALITGITVHETVAYREASYFWAYSNSGRNQDADHNSYSAESMYRLAYWTGREVAYQMMSQAWTGTAAPIVHTRLAGLPGGIASQGFTDPSTTVWCEKSDAWRAEQDAYLASMAGGDRAAQFAYYASHAARQCA